MTICHACQEDHVLIGPCPWLARINAEEPEPHDIALFDALTAMVHATYAFADLNCHGFNAAGFRVCPRYPEQIGTSLAFIDVCQRIELAKMPNINSYALKHIVERWGAANGLEPYVSNGALITAAIWRRLPIKRWPSLNCAIGISPRALRTIGRRPVIQDRRSPFADPAARILQ